MTISQICSTYCATLGTSAGHELPFCSAHVFNSTVHCLPCSIKYSIYNLQMLKDAIHHTM